MHHVRVQHRADGSVRHVCVADAAHRAAAERQRHRGRKRRRYQLHGDGDVGRCPQRVGFDHVRQRRHEVLQCEQHAMTHFAPIHSARHRQQGLTLVELMVAITIGLILTAGIIQNFVSSNQTYRVEVSLSRLQESARLALEFISNDIRMTSYWGCQPDRTAIVSGRNTGGAEYIEKTKTSLTGTEGGSNPDSITLRGADGSIALPLLPNSGTNYSTNPAAALQVAAGTFNTGNIVLVSDCTAGNIFQVTGGTGGQLQHAAGAGSPGNNSASLSSAYAAAAPATGGGGADYQTAEAAHHDTGRHHRHELHDHAGEDGGQHARQKYGDAGLRGRGEDHCGRVDRAGE